MPDDMFGECEHCQKGDLRYENNQYDNMLLIILFHRLAEIRLLEPGTTSSPVWPNFGSTGAYLADTRMLSSTKDAPTSVAAWPL
ncbi:hypothetical protein OKW45_007904 [Paraburkholderia sp. WSM4175]